LYAGIISNTPNRGAATWINAFGGLIEQNTMSVLEMVVGCRKNGEMWQQVGIAASRDWSTNSYLSSNFADPLLRVQVEFLTQGASKENLGDNKGGWDGIFKGFVRTSTQYAPGQLILNWSTVGGPQYEYHYEIQLRDGKWWVGWLGTWLGYYPASLFTEMSSQACEVNWYAEVYDPFATPTMWTWTDMGSGQFASAGWGNAAYFRNPMVLDLGGAFQWPTTIADPNVINNACYTRSALFAGMWPWNRFFFVGGPGGDAPAGNCP
jgi:hypothetical protein